MPSADDEAWDGRVPVHLLNPFDFSMIDRPFQLPLPALAEMDAQELRELFNTACATAGVTPDAPSGVLGYEGWVEEETSVTSANDTNTGAGKGTGTEGGSAGAGEKRSVQVTPVPLSPISLGAREASDAGAGADADTDAHADTEHSNTQAEPAIERHKESELYMIQHLAAETIQESWQVWRACVTDKLRVKRLKASQREGEMAKALAAETIQYAVREYLLSGPHSHSANTCEGVGEETEPDVVSEPMDPVGPVDQSHLLNPQSLQPSVIEDDEGASAQEGEVYVQEEGLDPENISRLSNADSADALNNADVDAGLPAEDAAVNDVDWATLELPEGWERRVGMCVCVCVPPCLLVSHFTYSILTLYPSLTYTHTHSYYYLYRPTEEPYLLC